jgi:hypothetical protein
LKLFEISTPNHLLKMQQNPGIFTKLTTPIYATPVSQEVYDLPSPPPLPSKILKNKKKPITLSTPSAIDVFIQDLHDELEDIEDEAIDMSINKVGRVEQIEQVKEKPIDTKLISSEEKFWEYIEKLRWTDKSDRVISPNFIKAKIRSDLNDADLAAFKQYLNKNMETLSNKLQLEGVFALPLFNSSDPNSEKNKKDLLSHIVARGSIIYSSICEDPAFANYLVGEDSSPDYQSLYSCLP